LGLKGIRGKKSKKLKALSMLVHLTVALVLFLSVIIPSTAKADTTDSNDRRAGLINLGKGVQDANGASGEINSLTGDELKTLGVFLSNFYVPFSTQIGKGNSDEDTKAIKQQMVDVLTKTGSFTDEVANAIVDAVLQVANNPKPLYFSYSTNGGKTYKPARTKGKNGRQATFYEFLDQISGYAYKNLNELAYPSKSAYESDNLNKRFSVYNDPNYGYQKGGNNRGALFWSDSGGTSVDPSHVVFDWNPSKSDGGGQTASQTVMAEIYKYLDAKNSVGTAFLDYTDKERGGNKSSNELTNLVKAQNMKGQTIEKLYKHSMYAWTMWVDAFGDILVDTGERQYVVVPAAMNPYVFKKNGKTDDGEFFGYGRSVPLNNLISITLASQNKLLKSGSAPTKDKATLNIGNIFSQFPKVGDNRGLYKFPGDNNTDWNESKLFNDWGSVLLDALTTQYGINAFGLKRAKGWSDWLTLGQSPRDTQRYVNSDLGTNKITGGTAYRGVGFAASFPYAFNSARPSHHLVYAPKSGLNKTPTHYVIQDLVAFDTFGLLNADTFKKYDGSLDSIKRAGIWDDSGKPAVDTTGITEGSAFGKSLDGKRGKLDVATNQVTKDLAANIYVAYVLAGLGGDDKIGFSIGFNRFPTYDGQTVLNQLSPEQQQQANNQEVMNMAYYFLHPTEGVSYFARWVKTKIGALLVGWHNDMTGANSSSNTTGLTKYIGFTGFTTMPSLNDMEWTSWMTSTYLSWGIYIIIAVVLAMVVYIAIGEISVQRAIAGVLVFSACLYLPPTAINSVVGLTNEVSNQIYNNKFLHWGITQLQTYGGKVDELAQEGKDGNQADYSQTLMSLQNDGMYSNNTSLGNGVTLRWMAPKKDDYLGQIQQELNNDTGGRASSLQNLTGGLISKAINGETYLDSNHALYLYRTFTDITNYSRFIYGNLMGSSVYDTNGSVSHDIGDIAESLSTVGMGKQYKNYLIGTGQNSLYERKAKGFINDSLDAIDGASSNKQYLKRIYAPLSSQTVSDAANVNIDKVNIGDKVGVSSKDFQATIKNFNNHTQTLKDQLKSSDSSENLASTSSFALYTESPYYYFSWFLYDNGLSTKSTNTGAFKNLMLGNKDRFFYNYDINKNSSGYGELKDYFDMGTLFTVVIPYLRRENVPLIQWSNIYGDKPFPDVSTNEDDASRYSNKNSESYYKYWFNTNLERLYNLYSPWVDAMYDSNYAKPQTIEYAGKRQVVEDPIDPASYKIRPMVFSESEMAYYGLKEYNLTDVEKKIIKVQRETRNDLLQLMNYYTFDDPVLDSTAAMIMTFNFDKEFSQNNFLNESYVLNPQGFELKNFTYDAYLRLILANTTGESLTNNQSDSGVSVQDNANIYDRVVEKSSIFTGILLVVGDVLACYVIPVMKFLFLVLVFLLSVLSIFVKALRVEISFRSVLWDSLAKPLVQFCSVTIAHALVISFFMGNGATGVTGDTSVSVSLGDPSMVLITLILINSIAIVLYSLIVWNLIRNTITYGKLAYNIIGGIVSSGVGFVGGKLGGLAMATQSGVLGGETISKTPNSSSYSSDPNERGRRNVQPDSTLESDLRTRDINTKAYADEVGKRKQDNVNVDDFISKGKEKLEKESSNDMEHSPDLEDLKRNADDIKKKYNLD
jgi:hypothetical protein